MRSATPLDLDTLSPENRPSLVLDAFDGLAPGQTRVLLGKVPLDEVLDLLQARRKGLFEWAPRARKEGVVEVEVTRRRASRGSLRRLTEALEWDHDRLATLERKLSESLQTGDEASALHWFSAFRSGLERHMLFEEELLFPVFEMRARLPHGGPTAVMRAEHRQIGAYLEEIEGELERGGSLVAAPRQALHELLEAHNRKEELILYPGTDRLLTEPESDALVARIQAFPP